MPTNAGRDQLAPNLRLPMRRLATLPSPNPLRPIQEAAVVHTRQPVRQRKPLAGIRIGKVARQRRQIPRWRSGSGPSPHLPTTSCVRMTLPRRFCRARARGSSPPSQSASTSNTRQRSAPGANGCSLGSSTTERISDHANSAGNSIARCAAIPSRSANSSASQRPSTGCGTTIRSGASGSPGLARICAARASARLSSWFETCRRNGDVAGELTARKA